MITDADAFDDGEDAIEYALAHISDTPLDQASEDELRDELAMLNAVLEWEKPRHEWRITGRQTAIQTALDADEPFDTPENSRKGNRYLDSNGRLVILDGRLGRNDAIITHYHYIIVADNGEIDRPVEARKTLPDDEDTHWLPVGELDALLAEGTLRPAEVVPTEETILDLLREGLSPAPAVDYWGTKRLGYTQEGWADERGVGQGTVGGNVSTAKDDLDEA